METPRHLDKTPRRFVLNVGVFSLRGLLIPMEAESDSYVEV